MIGGMPRPASTRVALLLAAGALLAGCGDSGKGASTTKPALPAPAFAQTVNVSPVSGRVLVEPSGTGGFDTLSAARQVPVGSAVDARGGVVRLTAATGTSGRVDAGEFQAGIFEIRQDRAEPGVTELRIRDDARGRAACGGRPSARVFGRLLGDAKGRFRTRGRFSTATIRGTNWGVRDRCDGTLTIVRRGVVVVTDLRGRKDAVVRAGHTLLVKAP
jgi:hypothetical protein